MGKMVWHRNYAAIAATPMGVLDIVIGELLWMAIRLATIATAFTIVMSGFHIPSSPLVLLAIPAAVLTGLAFSAPIMAYAATLKSSGPFNVLLRFIITPLFLFSGVFFPISQLPPGLQKVAWFTPLFHGVELTRSLTLSTIPPSPDWIVHVTYLLVLLLIGVAAGFKTFDAKLLA
jgi:lipooligosaccharide transport system permease protein